MAALTDLYIKFETLETLYNVAKTKKMKGVALTVALNNEQDKYGNNITSWVSQSKEDREAKKNKFYVGNGKVLWTDGQIVKSEKEQAAAPKKTETFEDTPF